MHGTDAHQPSAAPPRRDRRGLTISTTATASAPSCTIRGTDRSETLTGTSGRDVICGKGGNDRLHGMGGDDVLLGGDGHDTLEGGAGNDSLQGEKGNDTVDGGAGDDSVSGGDGSDVLAGQSGKDALDGGGGVDSFFAGADADAVKAADGRRDWVISCGAGTDSLTADAKDPKAHECEGGDTPPPPPPAPKADLAVSLTDDADPVVEGAAVEYRFNVTNAGPDTAKGVSVATTFPADATIDAAGGCSTAGSVVTCSVPELASGSSAGGEITVRYASAGAKSVTSTVDAETADPGAANDSATQTTTVEPKPAPAGAGVAVHVLGMPGQAAPLANVAYTVDVSNAGPLTAEGVVLSMEIDPLWSAIGRPTGCTQTMFPVTRVNCNLGALAAGDSVSKVLNVSWSDPGDRTVKATVTSTTADPDASDNTETEHTSVG